MDTETQEKIIFQFIDSRLDEDQEDNEEENRGAILSLSKDLTEGTFAVFETCDHDHEIHIRTTKWSEALEKYIEILKPWLSKQTERKPL